MHLLCCSLSRQIGSEASGTGNSATQCAKHRTAAALQATAAQREWQARVRRQPHNSSVERRQRGDQLSCRQPVQAGGEQPAASRAPQLADDVTHASPLSVQCALCKASCCAGALVRQLHALGRDGAHDSRGQLARPLLRRRAPAARVRSGLCGAQLWQQHSKRCCDTAHLAALLAQSCWP